MKLVTLLSLLIFATSAAEAKSLYCRLSHNMKNQDFQIELPALEPTPYDMGGFIGKTSKKISSGDKKLEVSVTLIDTDGVKFGSPKNQTEKSIGLEIKLLSHSIMQYSISAQSNSLLQSFDDQVNSSINLDTTPLGLEGKYFLWCQSNPIN